MHTHPGEEIIYVLEGTLEYEIEGKPSVKVKPGEVLFVPAGAAHLARNVGSGNGGGARHICRRKREAAHHTREVTALTRRDRSHDRPALGSARGPRRGCPGFRFDRFDGEFAHVGPCLRARLVLVADFRTVNASPAVLHPAFLSTPFGS